MASGSERDGHFGHRIAAAVLACDLLPPLQLFSSVTASLLLDLIFSALKGHAGNMSSPGLVSFGYVGVRTCPALAWSASATWGTYMSSPGLASFGYVGVCTDLTLRQMSNIKYVELKLG